MKVALIGLGEAGSTLHLPALSGLPLATVVGVCDRDPDQLARVAAAWRVPPFADVDRLLDEARPEVVVVGTPPLTHAALCVRALSAGAHVICEKPFVASVEQCGPVLTAAAAARRQVALNHEFREMPIFRTVLDAIRSGRDGALLFAQVWQLLPVAPSAESGWRGQLTRRTLFEAGVHLLDVLVALFGEFPITVQASTSAAGIDRQGRDAVVAATFGFSNGRLGVLLQDRVCRGERHYFEIRADTERASWRASFGGRARLSAGVYHGIRPHLRFEYGASGLAWRETATRRTVVARNPRRPNVAATRAVFARTLAAFRDGTEPPTSGVVGQRLLEIVEACYASAASGRRVETGPSS